ncbi:sensor histidine kinase [Segnochrobactrum spirostomi]|uniref:histidine kinase n=1 Tax=Segnochrobactrum spirostomi TaxID=2608987 RepID=A0A6A7Y9P1_9HYPH|nr:sensor histidine kinase [Segnochrobactrum spirostomi]MQT15465.1 hypothetical protein [Segnochrobactrum spirostomi]
MARRVEVCARLRPSLAVFVSALFVSLMAIGQLAADPLPLHDRDQVVAASGHMAALFDPTGTMSLPAVIAAVDQFQPVAGPFNGGYSQGAWWLRLAVRPEAGAGGAWLLQLVSPYTDSIEIYAPRLSKTGRDELALQKTGALVPIPQRDFASHLFVVRTDLEEGRDQAVYVRLTGSRPLTAAPYFWRLSPFMGHLTFDVLRTSFIVGAAFMTAAGSLIFGLWLRVRGFVWYGIYLGFAAWVIAGNSGFMTLLLSPLEPAFILRMQTVVGCLTILTAAMLVRSIFCADGRARVAAWFLQASALLSSVFTIYAAAGLYRVIAPFQSVNLIAVCVLIPILAIAKVRRGEPAAWWYLVGFGAYSLSGIWFMLMVLGVLPLSTGGERGYQVVSTLTMVAIFVGLATSLRAGLRERRNLQAQLLEASQHNEQVLTQAVTERTRELQTEVEARRAAEAALRVAMSEQRHFLTMVSHEFRTPLGAIRAAAAVVQRRLAPLDEAARREAERIVRTAARLAYLVDAFLAEEVLDKSTFRPRREAVDVTELVGDVCREMAQQSGRDIAVTGSATGLMKADPGLLRTAVGNLVGNALKYSERPVAVEIAERAEGIAVAVRDEGPGIPEAERTAIFERFYRSGHDRTQGGTGIGLSIVKRIVSVHGGALQLDSEIGRGSTFTMVFPWSAPGVVAAPDVAASAARPAALAG